MSESTKVLMRALVAGLVGGDWVNVIQSAADKGQVFTVGDVESFARLVLSVIEKIAPAEEHHRIAADVRAAVCAVL